jgi:hypothetical protein
VIPEYPVWEIERKATEVLVQAYPHGLPGPPVDIEWVIEGPVGLEIRPIPRLGHDGMLCCLVGHGYLIVVDEALLDQAATRYRFTLGEELGHYVLHSCHLRRVATIAEGIRQYRSIENWHRVDRNARRFAAAILMPLVMLVPDIERAYRACVRTTGFDDAGKIRKFLVDYVADAYEVSKEAADYRFRENRGYLDRRIAKGIEQRLEWLP